MHEFKRKDFVNFIVYVVDFVNETFLIQRKFFKSTEMTTSAEMSEGTFQKTEGTVTVFFAQCIKFIEVSRWICRRSLIPFWSPRKIPQQLKYSEVCVVQSNNLRKYALISADL